jgi:small subunit ribosomal protein S6e
MPFKFNIATKEGKTFKLEAEGEALIGKDLHDKVEGNEISIELENYEFEITGASDKSGFTSIKEVDGIGLKKVLLTYGKGMKKRPRKEGKKKVGRNKPKGLRLRKTVRGRTISEAISQINLKILKQGKKKLEEIFPEQVKQPESKKVEETPKEKVEEKKE